LEPAVSSSDDVIGIGASDEWPRVLGIVFANEAVDGGLKVTTEWKTPCLILK